MPKDSALPRLLLLILPLLLGGCAKCGRAAPEAQPETFLVGVVPFLKPEVQRLRMEPLMARLAKALGVQKAELVLVDDAETLASKLRSHDVHVGWMRIHSYLDQSQDGDLVPLVSPLWNYRDEYRGAIVVPTQSPIQKLAQLRGKRVAFVERTSASGYMFPLLMLQAAGVDESALGQVAFEKKHHAVLKALLAGRYDAGAVYHTAINELPAADQRKLRTLETSAPIPSEPLVVLNSVPELVRRYWREAFLQIDLHGQTDGGLGRPLVKGLTGFEKAEPEAYDSLRTLWK